MKKKMNIITLVLVIITIIIIIIGLYIGNIVHERKTVQKNIELIKYNYNEFTNNILEFNQIRTNLSNKLNNFVYTTYIDEHQNYIELLNKYTDNIKKIDANVSNITKRCDFTYNDKNINIICDSYESAYEKMVNLYVSDVINYNNKIKSYNEQYITEEELGQFDAAHKEYIDYNNDKKYEGKEVTNEKNN